MYATGFLIYKLSETKHIGSIRIPYINDIKWIGNKLYINDIFVYKLGNYFDDINDDYNDRLKVKILSELLEAIRFRSDSNCDLNDLIDEIKNKVGVTFEETETKS